MKKTLLLIPLILVFFITIGFSAFETNLLVDSIGVEVRPYKLVRVTNIENPTTSNNATSTSYDYNVDNINGKIKLPNSNSKVTYSVTITNFGTQDVGILNMSLSNNDLDYDIDNVQKIERICNTNNECNGGITRTYSVTIKYKSGATTTNSDIEFIATFNFKNYYTITYSGFDSTTGLPTGILQDDTKTITFNTTTGMPSNVTVTGATGTYTNPATTNPNTATLALTTVTGNITITAVNQVTPDMAYTTLLSIFTNSTASEDSSCENTLTKDNTTNQNLRFIGSKPCNYVYFNCSNPNNPTSSTCEKWRIIGVFTRNNNQVLKIINSSFYNNGSTVKFHTTNTTANRIWGTNSLSDTLNNTTSTTSYYNTMASNDNHNYIESTYWPVGPYNSTAVKPAAFYSSENKQLSTSSVPFGLLNLTDIYYGTNNTSCWNTNMNSWNSSCMEKSSVNWLYEEIEYTLSVYSANSYYVYKMQDTFIPYRTQLNSSLKARIVTFLKTNTYFYDGNGSSNDPYILKLYN